MRFSLLPKNTFFYDLLEELAIKSLEGVKVCKELVLNWTKGHPHLHLLKDIEHACDQIVHEIMVRLNKTFVTPIDREDIHTLTKKIDDLVDLTQALSERMNLFQIKEIKPSLITLLNILEKSAESVVESIKKIKNLKESQALLNICIQINTLENQGDRAFEMALGQLFNDHLDSLEVIKWKEIYEYVERAIDKCEDIADIVWGIVVKYG